MSNQFFERPIVNSPYKHPQQYWELDETGQPTGVLADRGPRADFVTEVAAHLVGGTRLLQYLKVVKEEPNPSLVCLALHLATCAGKTTVRAMLIA